MIGWMVSVAMTYASPCPDAFDETVAQLVQRGDVQAYGCAVAWSGDDQAFVEQIRKGDERANPSDIVVSTVRQTRQSVGCRNRRIVVGRGSANVGGRSARASRAEESVGTPPPDFLTMGLV